MRQNSFTPQELVCMALLAGEENIAGIPDVFAGVPESAVAVMVQDNVDKLMELGVASMDFDGAVILEPDYRELVQFFSACDSCMTVNHQKKDHTFQTLIYWRLGGRYLMAEAVGGKYILSQPDPACTGSNIAWEGADSPSEEGETLAIPQVFLEKAKRYLEDGKAEQMQRILMQNGADERMVCVIGDSLAVQGECLVLLLMEKQEDQWTMTEKSWLCSRGVTLEIGKGVENFRTCLTFTPRSGQQVRQELEDMFSLFWSWGEGSGG